MLGYILKYACFDLSLLSTSNILRYMFCPAERLQYMTCRLISDISKKSFTTSKKGIFFARSGGVRGGFCKRSHFFRIFFPATFPNYHILGTLQCIGAIIAAFISHSYFHFHMFWFWLKKWKVTFFLKTLSSTWAVGWNGCCHISVLNSWTLPFCDQIKEEFKSSNFIFELLNFRPIWIYNFWTLELFLYLNI